MKNITNTAIAKLHDIHKRIAVDLDLSKKDNNVALYILSGRILTSLEALKMLFSAAFVTEANMIIRSIYESLWLAQHLYHTDDKKLLLKWFSNDIIRPKKSRSAQGKLPEFRNFPEGAKIFIDACNDLYIEMSNYVHPTFKRSLINLNVGSNLFDYTCTSLKDVKFKYPISFSFEQTVISIINMFLSCRAFYRIDDNEYEELRQIRNELDQVY